MEELVELAKNGDKMAFTELILSIKDELYGIARSKLNNEDDIDDAVQETMIRGFKAIHTLEDNKFWRTWMVRILINECLRIYKLKKYDEVFGIIEFTEINTMELNTEMSCSELSKFNFIIERLDFEERVILKMFYQYKFQLDEIGYALDRNTNTIKTILCRAREKLKENLQKGGE